MQLSTLARDCLYVNWAVPLESAHDWDGGQWIFASALLFRLSGLHLESLPFARVSYPQMNLRLYVLDEEGQPSVLFLRMLVPFWIAPMSRLLGRQPATAASLSYPSPSQSPDDGSWTWTIGRRPELEIHGRLASPGLSATRGPRLGSWEQTVEFFRHRRRGYAMWDNRLRSVRTSHPAVPVWPLEVEVSESRLVAACMPEVETDVWLSPHSTWLCPEVPFYFELGKPIEMPLASGGMPAAEGLSGLRPDVRA